MGSIMLNPKYVYGGPTNILTTDFKASVLPLFDNPPKAYLHRQGNFVTGFMPEAIQKNLEEEVGVFALPSIDPKWGTPVLGGGDQFVVFNDRPEVQEFMAYLRCSLTRHRSLRTMEIRSSANWRRFLSMRLCSDSMRLI
jgi:alpha-glucoside transport system substrate-binding protein